MNDLELERALQAWGRVYGERRESEWDEDGEQSLMVGGSVHPIAIAMDFAAKGDKSNPVAYRRPREAVKAWRDPAYAKVTRSPKGAMLGAFSRPVDPVAARVEDAVMSLQRIDTALGMVLRFQYCRRGTQAEKAVWMSERVPVTLRTYRDMLVRARCWMQGRLSA